MSVGVNVSVGTSVGDGDAVEVSVGKSVGEAGAGWNGVGGGLAVPVGSITGVGAGLARNVNPPHPINNSAASDIQIKNFCKLLMFPAESFANYAVDGGLSKCFL